MHRKSIPPLNCVYVWTINLAVRSSCIDDLSATEREKADRFVFSRDRDRYIAAHLAMRHILGDCLQVTPAVVELKNTPLGKPFISMPRHTSCNFNLSHSGDMGVLAISNSNEIGIDIETIDNSIFNDGLAGSVLSDTERAALGRMACESKTEAFFCAWTRKEAYLKALGTGLGKDDLREIDVGIEPVYRGIPSPYPAINCSGADFVEIFTLDLHPGFASALAVVNGDTQSIEVFDYSSPAKLSSRSHVFQRNIARQVIAEHNDHVNFA